MKRWRWNAIKKLTANNSEDFHTMVKIIKVPNQIPVGLLTPSASLGDFDSFPTFQVKSLNTYSIYYYTFDSSGNCMVICVSSSELIFNIGIGYIFGGVYQMIKYSKYQIKLEKRQKGTIEDL